MCSQNSPAIQSRAATASALVVAPPDAPPVAEAEGRWWVIAEGEATTCRHSSTALFICSNCSGYFLNRFRIATTVAVARWDPIARSWGERKLRSCSVTYVAALSRLMPTVPRAFTALFPISVSTSDTYSASSAQMSKTVASSVRWVRISIFTLLTYEGSLYLQKKCLKSPARTVLDVSLCCRSRRMWERTEKANSEELPVDVNVISGSFRRSRTCACS
mmetsp:Transcript_19443/g.39125  ORF Transcript_19443/g.39125 Transcript_19443/m.39125 type:complete len:218 (+) Transcript_19443:485-1138(+)